MHKYFRLSGLFLSLFALFVCGCGGGGSAADPMGTATVQFIDEDGKVLVPQEGGGIFAFSILPGESRQLIVKVTNAREGGATIVPVISEKVTFTLLTPANGGSVTMVNDRTDANGRAVGIYTAGNNFEFDEVRATTEAGATAQLTIIKTGGIVGSRISSLSASSTTVAADQTIVVTAKVTDGYSNPVQYETVTFTLPVNKSGASFVNAAGVNVSSISVNTDASGNAVAIYRAGSTDPLTAVYDTVRGALANGSGNTVVITRSAGTGLSISLAALDDTVIAGQSSIVTATLTGDDNVGVTVTFSLPVNQSGASLSAPSAVTDGSGKAAVSYTAGSNDPTLTVSDVVQATVGSISSSAAISRTGTGTPTQLSIGVTASPTSVTAGNVSIVIATLTGDDNAGVTVTFTLPVNNSGATLSASSAVTDGSGNAVVIYEAGTNTPTLTVDDTVKASVGSISSSKVITRSAGVVPITTITLTAAPSAFTIEASGGSASSAITATVKNANGTVQQGITITFTVYPVGKGTFTHDTVTTGEDGRALTILTLNALVEGTYVVLAESADPLMSEATYIVVTQPDL